MTASVIFLPLRREGLERGHTTTQNASRERSLLHSRVVVFRPGRPTSSALSSPCQVTGTEWTALFRIHSRMADRLRAGNTFLVGDAAHTRPRVRAGGDRLPRRRVDQGPPGRSAHRPDHAAEPPEGAGLATVRADVDHLPGQSDRRGRAGARARGRAAGPSRTPSPPTSGTTSSCPRRNGSAPRRWSRPCRSRCASTTARRATRSLG
ncbi:FAD-dependent monooxygenase [Nonomuraea sp. NPDC050790]|uniref:FAD-dependent monooxygenase n=1 Tax=Nonomuraea sp. NPDC050790 TaxID=3364371 RepID=UPI0037B8E5DE